VSAGRAGSIFLSLLLVATSLAPFQARAQHPAPITVSAAISLKDALDEVEPAYERSHPGAAIEFNYGSSGTLQHQIEQGAPVDIFFSAAERQMDKLESEGLIAAKTRRNVIANALVLIAPAGSSGVKDFQDLARPDVKVVALGELETVPAGMYAQETLDFLGLLPAVRKKAVYGKDVRQVLTYVETANADAGLVYVTDAHNSSKVRIVATAPENSHEPILYPVAVLKGSKQPAAAEAFLEFLTGLEARAIFVKYGFKPLER
jgi:molybdate transport system substrate-binding protein